MMQIQAAILHEPNGHFTIESLTLDEPKADEVLVKIAASGVCHSDWHVATGTTMHPMPCVAGHEGAGVVQAVGDGVTQVKVGDHVVLSWTPDCGQCFYCLHNQPNLCETYTEPIWNGVMLDGTSRLHLNDKPVYIYCGLGTFAEYAVVSEMACIPIPSNVPLQTAALVGCAVATGVGAALYTSPVKPGDSVVVYGVGGIGLNIIQGAYLAGATTIIAVDIHQSKIDLARDFGATHGVLATDSVLSDVRTLTFGRGADHVFEAVGLPHLQELCLELARPGGVVTFVGLSPMGSSTNLPGSILTRTEKTVRGSYYGSVSPKRDFPRFIEMYQSRRLKLDELVSKTYALLQINVAYEHMLRGDVARCVILFD